MYLMDALWQYSRSLLRPDPTVSIRVGKVRPGPDQYNVRFSGRDVTMCDPSIMPIRCFLSD